MVIPDKDIFTEEIQIIENIEVKNMLMQLYSHLKGDEELDDVQKLIDDIVNKLFGNTFIKDPIITYSFMKSTIGRMLFSAMYETEKLYTIKDLMDILKERSDKGFGKANISRDIVVNQTLKGHKKGKSYFFTRDQINEYLRCKGLKEI